MRRRRDEDKWWEHARNRDRNDESARQVKHPIDSQKREGHEFKEEARWEQTRTAVLVELLVFDLRTNTFLLIKRESNNIENIENRKVCIFNRNPKAKSSFALELSARNISGTFLLTKIKNACQKLMQWFWNCSIFHNSWEILYVETHLFTIFETIESIKLNNMNDDV